MTSGDGFHTIDIAQHHTTGRAEAAARTAWSRTSRSRSPVTRHCASVCRPAEEPRRNPARRRYVCSSIYSADPTATGWKSTTRCRGPGVVPKRSRRRGRSAAVEQRGRSAAPVARRGLARPRRDGQSRAAAPPTGTTGGRLTFPAKHPEAGKNRSCRARAAGRLGAQPPAPSGAKYPLQRSRNGPAHDHLGSGGAVQ